MRTVHGHWKGCGDKISGIFSRPGMTTYMKTNFMERSTYIPPAFSTTVLRMRSSKPGDVRRTGRNRGTLVIREVTYLFISSSAALMGSIRADGNVYVIDTSGRDVIMILTLVN